MAQQDLRSRLYMDLTLKFHAPDNAPIASSVNAALQKKNNIHLMYITQKKMKIKQALHQ